MDSDQRGANLSPWLGGWHDVDRIRDYVLSRNDLKEHDFAILKWLRTPVLHPVLEPVFMEAVMQSPLRFIRTWLMSEGLPLGICQHAAILGCDSVVRHFLWNRFSTGASKDAIASVGLCRDRFDRDNCVHHLEKLIEVSLPLFTKGIRECQRKCQQQSKYLLSLFLHSILGLEEKARRPKINYRFQGLKNRTLSATGLDSEQLDDLVWGCIQSIKRPMIKWIEEDLSNLHRLAETYSGRKYLSARIAEYWLNPNDD